MKNIILFLGLLLFVISSCEEDQVIEKGELSNYLTYESFSESGIEYEFKTNHHLIYHDNKLERIIITKTSEPQYIDSTDIVSEAEISFLYNDNNDLAQIKIDKRDLWIEHSTNLKMFCNTKIEKQISFVEDTIKESLKSFKNRDFDKFESLVIQTNPTTTIPVSSLYECLGFSFDTKDYYYTYDDFNKLISIGQRKRRLHLAPWGVDEEEFKVSNITYENDLEISEINTDARLLEDNVYFLSYSDLENPLHQINIELGYPFIKDYLLLCKTLPNEYRHGNPFGGYGTIKIMAINDQVTGFCIEDNISGNDRMKQYEFKYSK